MPEMQLRRGKHMPGDGEACAMEYLSWRNLKQWTDRPSEVTPIVAYAVHGLNDIFYTEEDRWRIVNEYGERIMQSRLVHDNDAHKATRRAMHDWLRTECTRLAAEAALTQDKWIKAEVIEAREILRAYGNTVQMANAANSLARAWAYIGSAPAFAFLDRLLTAYEKASSDAILERIALV